MGLREYQRKRDFRKTSEPRGARGKSRGAPRFVVQKHDATRLHYDFRLEHDGTLKSWAVPKGPSLDPKERRLAVEVEDHPLDYGGFEGTIPKGEYGGGTVLLWDRGTWHPEGDPAKGLRSGRLKFRLAGEKLRGGWTLVRMADKAGRPAGKPNWLLIKERDDEARAGAARDILAARPESVKSGRDLPAIAAGERPKRRQPAKAAKAAKRPVQTGEIAETGVAPARATRRRAAKSLAVPEVPSPQLATLVAEVPAGDDWLHEIKLDGYRILARAANGEASLWTRGGKDWADHFPAVARAVAALEVSTAIVDGEVVALLPDGRSSFQALQRALTEGSSAQLAYFVFDLLHLDGVDWSGRPLLERKAALRKLLPARTSAGVLRYHDHVRGDGAAFYRQACALGLEGSIAKRAGTRYRPGRSSDWLKIKCSLRQEFVIGAFTEPSGSRTGLGALLLGVYDGDRLRYAGRVGTGFATATLRELRSTLEPLERATPPFADPPRGAQARGVRWVRPELVAEVSFTEWTDDGLLRHPTFAGLRADKPARAVRRERPVDAKPAAAPAPAPAARSGGSNGRGGGQAPHGRAAKRQPATPAEHAERTVAGVRLSNPDRVLWPEQGTTKLDLASYYQRIADWILPHVGRRPLTLVRCPQGRAQHCFFQKHIKEGAPGLLPLDVREDSGATAQYFYLEELTGLIGLVQMGTLEIHGWGSRIEDVERPDRLVFDLDPDPAVPWAQVVAAARLFRARLEELDLRSFVQTTGGKGLHVVVPLSRRQTWDEAKPFARAFAAAIESEAPERFLTKASKSARKGRIFLDWLRNGRGATAILAYSSRARPGAPVATPVAWEELDKLQPGAFTVATVPDRLAKLRRDPWADFWSVRQSLRLEIRKKLGAA